MPSCFCVNRTRTGDLQKNSHAYIAYPSCCDIQCLVNNWFISSVQFTSFLPAALCSVPADISNGTVMFTTTSVGDTATYSCDSGFELIGGATTTCTEVDANSAEFLPQPPVCKREYCMNVTGVATVQT